jgi:ADP-ribosyl-[dinitrogen reductase] hydrolase
MKLTQEQCDVLLAGAIGDAVGYPIEFCKVSDIEEWFGPQGFLMSMLSPNEPLTVSDDTQMTLFALEALHTRPLERIDAAHYRNTYLQWLLTQANPTDAILTSPLASSFPSLHFRRAPGGTCLSSLLAREPLPDPINDSKGCGGVMRAAPFGFLPNFHDAVHHGAMQARVTHGNGSGYVPAGYFAGLIHTLMHGFPIHAALRECDAAFDRDPAAEETLDIVRRAVVIAMASDSRFGALADIRMIGEGWTGHEALAIAVYTLIVARSFEDVVHIAVNHDGDSDSTGSLAAQLWVARHGLPEEYRGWLKRLDVAAAFEFAMDGRNYATATG